MKKLPPQYNFHVRYSHALLDNRKLQYLYRYNMYVMRMLRSNVNFFVILMRMSVCNLFFEMFQFIFSFYVRSEMNLDHLINLHSRSF